VVGSANASNATFYDKLNFNFIRDIAPVAGVFRGPYVMVVNPSVPASTVPEFIAYAKATPRKVNMASSGIGTVPHVAGELFKMMAGIDMVHVPYRGGGPALTDLLAGQVQVYFATTVASIGYIRAGSLRALGDRFAHAVIAADAVFGERSIDLGGEPQWIVAVIGHSCICAPRLVNSHRY
jgi:tripartite-type tricarboxylate transporter receptor subunit TctC